MPKLFWVAGEASGDRHAAGVMRALCGLDSAWQFTGWGGPKMAKLADEQRFHDWIADAAVVGFWEVLKHYGYFREQMKSITSAIARENPDAVVLVDYPGFNLRLAKRLRKSGYGGRIVYYISPQVWAWNTGRVSMMARCLDLMLCIFPFEPELYQRSGLRAEFTGHPMMAEVGGRDEVVRDPKLVALLPGSRRREVEALFPVMLEAAEIVAMNSSSVRFVAAAASAASAARMREIAAIADVECEVREGEAWELMEQAGVGLVASGTASLEAACLDLPYALVYKVAAPTYWLGKRLVKVPHIGMANLLAGKEIVPELIQHQATPQNMAREIVVLRDHPDKRQVMRAEFDRVRKKLVGQSDPYREAACRIIREFAVDMSLETD